MNNHPQKKSFIAEYGWIIGVALILATVIMQVVFWQVIPTFVSIYHDFGVENPAITSYYKVVSIIMILALIILIPIIMCLFFIDNLKFQQFVKWFFILYASALPVIFVGAIIVIYSNMFQMSAVA